ncbi:CBS domain-containing protein [Desulfobulbus rhabdoformis]|uniref:CBS domain-containing protein n=1 Tax=Desulfobulbus rhabdoformis TaxID=34032 RepID=UPI001966A102|nr:CBS domain-containing protein [Desulfobulbus rhabdoformis]
METYTVKDLMVPLEEYVTVPLGTTLLGAMLALEKAQENYDQGKYHHRAVLVLDRENKVVGRISQLRVLQAMETREENTELYAQLKMYQFSDAYVDKLRENDRIKCKVFAEETLKEATEKPVEDFMQKPTPDEYVDESEKLDLAMHKMVAGAHQSLLVTRDKDIVGILRMVDIFTASFHAMKSLGVA